MEVDVSGDEPSALASMVVVDASTTEVVVDASSTVVVVDASSTVVVVDATAMVVVVDASNTVVLTGRVEFVVGVVGVAILNPPNSVAAQPFALARQSFVGSTALQVKLRLITGSRHTSMR
jgi:ABC-type Fe3+-hydroxamate transport system substrate-binding protein